MIHELKVQPQFYHPLHKGDKTFEIRRNDRNFKVGDYLHLREWYATGPGTGNYTGRHQKAEITYIMTPEIAATVGFNLQPGFVVIGFSYLTSWPADARAFLKEQKRAKSIVTAKPTVAKFDLAGLKEGDFVKGLGKVLDITVEHYGGYSCTRVTPMTREITVTFDGRDY